MTADRLLDQLRAMGAAPPAAPALPALRPCAGGMPGQPCAARVDRRAPDGLCAACLEARSAAARRRAAAAAEQELLDALPELHRRVAFGTPELAIWCRDAAAVARAEELTRDFPRDVHTVLLTGPTSAGKSTLAAAMTRALRARRRGRASVVWLDARLLAGARRLAQQGVDAMIGRALGASLLVVDDLAKEQHLLEYERADLITVLELRHARHPDIVPDDAVTLITTEREVRASGAGAAEGDLASAYPLSFVRRIAGAWTDGDVARGSAVVIPVRRGS